MPKSKTSWQCQSCGQTSPKWAGQCSGCGKWNTLEEVHNSPVTKKPDQNGQIKKTTTSNQTIKNQNQMRTSTGFAEFDRVLGGGLVPDSLSLLVGDPGIGKSTLTLQAAKSIAENQGAVLIASGEESIGQIQTRAQRLGASSERLHLLNEFIIEDVLATAQKLLPALLIIDSVQTFTSGNETANAGSITQIRAVTEKVMQFAKTKNIPCLLIGHVNKEGNMAGPQMLAHLVDTVIVIEGDQHHELRMVRSTKNRFGSVFEVGVFQMTSSGLQEVRNPSEAFLSGRLENAIGSSIFPTIEGTRPFLVEIQALTSITKFGLPKRTTSGLSLSRLSIILAVLQNFSGLSFDNRDAYANVIGGFSLKEPAADLALALALSSSIRKTPLPSKQIAIGEIGLSGEIRAVSHLEKRLQEAAKMGFDEAVIPKIKNPPEIKGIKLRMLKTVQELAELLPKN
jgi:DNA repair protein RadA/Sms